MTDKAIIAGTPEWDKAISRLKRREFLGSVTNGNSGKAVRMCFDSIGAFLSHGQGGENSTANYAIELAQKVSKVEFWKFTFDDRSSVMVVVGKKIKCAECGR